MTSELCDKNGKHYEIIRFYYDIDERLWATAYPQYYYYIYQTNKINYYFANHILFSIVVSLECSLNADCNTISNSLQWDKHVDEKLQLKEG